MNSNVKTVIFWAVLICVAVLLWAVVKNGHTKPDKALNFSEFLTEVEAGNIKSVSINGSTRQGRFRHRTRFLPHRSSEPTIRSSTTC